MVFHLYRTMCQRKVGEPSLEKYLTGLLSSELQSDISLTRKGAGLTILFYKLIAGDTRSEKPLLKLAIETLMKSLMLDSSRAKLKIEEASNYDDACTLHLHFLKTLVADKQLQTHVAQYLERISLCCLEYLSSKVFAIRYVDHSFLIHFNHLKKVYLSLRISKSLNYKQSIQDQSI